VNDFKDYFESMVMKWKNILTFVMGFGKSTHMRMGLLVRRKESPSMVITKEFKITW
jgi:hypothetical protein